MAVTVTALASFLKSTPAPIAARYGGGGGMPDYETGRLAPLARPLADANRRIVKDATLTLEVGNVAPAVERLAAIAALVGGYVLETRTAISPDSGPDSATVRLAVPVEAFEGALSRIRAAAGRVLAESATGADVSEAFVDLESQIVNLTAAQARLRQLLDRANTVTETLEVHAKLTEIEDQIAQRKGRLQFLAQRAAYSTIAVELREPFPTVTPTLTATPTPTRTPTATATPGPTATPIFRPVAVARAATQRLAVGAGRAGEGLIWWTIIGLPFTLVLGLAVALWAMRRRRSPASGRGSDLDQHAS